jgi:RimJ/RimL family protein N-acetyltransferase
MTAALVAPSRLRDGEVTLLPLDAGIPALLVAASYDDEITRWTQVPRSLTLIEAGFVVAGWASNNRVARLQVCLPDLAPAGLVTVWINDRERAEVGYWLLEPARGRRVASRAVALLCDWAFARCAVDELDLTTLPGNTASERVAVACGFHSEGTVGADVKGEARTLRRWVRTRAVGTAGSAQRAAIGT